VARVVVYNHVTVDGVMQSPSHPDEDRRGGFEHGGWAAPQFDDVMLADAQEGMSGTARLLLGRVTYEQFAASWPNAPQDNPFTAVMNEARKYVASTTLEGPLSWNNSALLEGDAADAVAALKEREEGDLVVLGSGGLIQSLLRRNLIDAIRLPIHPIVLGGGRRLFPDGGVPAKFRLAGTKVTTTGVVIATYEPAGAA
jgi:dihydrofolate reductase